MFEALPFLAIGAVLGTVLKRLLRARRQRTKARARERLAVRGLLDELSAFATGLALDQERGAALRIADPRAVGVAWRDHRDALAGVPARDFNVLAHAVDSVDSETIDDARLEILAAIDVLRAQLD